MAKSKVVVFGNSTWADLADVYLTHDSPNEVVAFTVDGEFLKQKEHRGDRWSPLRNCPGTTRPMISRCSSP
jgi:hypothetical protein